MTRPTTPRTTAARRNLEVNERIAGGVLRPDTADPTKQDASEHKFRRLHADPRYRARLWL